MALCGFLLFLGIGGKTAAYTHENADYWDSILISGTDLDWKAQYAGLASMCILTSLVYLVDVVFSLINLKNA